MTKSYLINLNPGMAVTLLFVTHSCSQRHFWCTVKGLFVYVLNKAHGWNKAQASHGLHAWALIGGILGSVVFHAELVPGALIGTYMGARIGGQTEPCNRVAMALVGALVGALVDGILGSVVPGVQLVLGALIGIYVGARIVGLLTEEAGMWTIIVLMLLLVRELCLVIYL